MADAFAEAHSLGMATIFVGATPETTLSKNKGIYHNVQILTGRQRI